MKLGCRNAMNQWVRQHVGLSLWSHFLASDLGTVYLWLLPQCWGCGCQDWRDCIIFLGISAFNYMTGIYSSNLIWNLRFIWYHLECWIFLHFIFVFWFFFFLSFQTACFLLLLFLKKENHWLIIFVLVVGKIIFLVLLSVMSLFLHVFSIVF